MAEFIKETEIHLTGVQKAAVLLGELYGASAQVKSLLGLTDEETAKLNKAFRDLGHYNPDSSYQIKRETVVLEELMDYAAKNGIKIETAPKPARFRTGFIDKETEEVASMVQSNPDAVAKLLRDWLKD